MKTKTQLYIYIHYNMNN